MIFTDEQRSRPLRGRQTRPRCPRGAAGRAQRKDAARARGFPAPRRRARRRRQGDDGRRHVQLAKGFANAWHILPMLYDGLRAMANEKRAARRRRRRMRRGDSGYRADPRDQDSRRAPARLHDRVLPAVLDRTRTADTSSARRSRVQADPRSRSGPRASDVGVLTRASRPSPLLIPTAPLAHSRAR